MLGSPFIAVCNQWRGVSHHIGDVSQNKTQPSHYEKI